MFRKPKRNVRQRRVDSDEEDLEKCREETASAACNNEQLCKSGLEEIQSSIAKFKETRKASQKGKKTLASLPPVDSKRDAGRPPSAQDRGKSQLLSFEEDLRADDGEVFRVKKSSQSRRIMKEKASEHKKKLHSGTVESERDKKTSEPHYAVPKPNSWILSGKEAEALHCQEEDELAEAEKPADPLQKLLQSGAIPDAAAIHAARKQRQAARDGQFIPLQQRPASNRMHDNEDDHEEDDDDADDDDRRIQFAGIKVPCKREEVQNGDLEIPLASGGGCTSLNSGDRGDDRDEEHGWEEQQIRKAMKHPSGVLPAVVRTPDPEVSVQPASPKRADISVPSATNLEGIKSALQQRLTSLTEVHRRHESDLDKVVDDLVESGSEIERLKNLLPTIHDKLSFYQDLRGYIADLVECFNEKVANIRYLEEKVCKVKADLCKKLMERRREDVRDQLKELSSSLATSQTVASHSAEEAKELAARQQRAAERDGRRRRREQMRLASQKPLQPQHLDGMSSDDEISTSDQISLGKSRAEVESQARQIMCDVIDDFATIDGVKDKLESWKQQQPVSYSESFVSLCLPKIFSPLVRLQLLFWNPLAEHSSIESMSWYETLATYSLPLDEVESSLANDPDHKLLSHLVEKVVLVKVADFIQAAYDPLSRSQTARLTSLLKHFVDLYPSVNGESRPMRHLLTMVKERLKHCLDHDVYIPLGYPKHLLENGQSGHARFLSRQFWSAFKLFKNILSWHGLLSDSILVDLALNSLLSRYLVVALTLTPDPNDALNKARYVVAVIPSAWIKANLYREELKRLAQFLSNLLQSARQGPDFQKEVSSLLLFVGGLPSPLDSASPGAASHSLIK